MVKYILSIVLIISIYKLSAQDDDKYIRRKCWTTEYMNNLIEKYPEINKNREELERQTTEWIEKKHQSKQAYEVITIPVVVHVVYKTFFENISDTIIQSQIEVLNRDFRKMNPDTINIPDEFKSVSADVEIEFELATVDPDGNVTTGITRTETMNDIWAMDDINYSRMKFTSEGGHDIWDRDKYLNIWVCNIYDASESYSYIGFTQLPGGPSETDGVVIDYRFFGTIGSFYPGYGLGRTTVHEVGHWFNLNHLWGNDTAGCSNSDYVFDTPNQYECNYGCPSHPHISCGNEGDMYMNYMDYTTDSCMNMFTYGQKLRMLATLNGFRKSLKDPNFTFNHDDDDKMKVYPSPASDIVNIEFAETIFNNLKVWIYDSYGEIVYYKSFEQPYTNSLQLYLPDLRNGVYTISVASFHNNKVGRFVIVK